MPESFEGAIRHNRPERAARLLAEGADPNARAGDLWPLHHAARRGWVELAEVLIDAGADVDLCVDYSGTPLHWAVREPEGVSAVPLLLAHGADPNAVEPHSGSTPLHNAAAAGQVAGAAMLLAAGARINAPDGAKFTPLFRAAEAEQREMADLLLRLGAVLNLDAISLHNDLLRELHWLLGGERSDEHVGGDTELERRRALLLARAPTVVDLLPPERWAVSFCWPDRRALLRARAAQIFGGPERWRAGVTRGVVFRAREDDGADIELLVTDDRMTLTTRGVVGGGEAALAHLARRLRPFLERWREEAPWRNHDGRDAARDELFGRLITRMLVQAQDGAGPGA